MFSTKFVFSKILAHKELISVRYSNTLVNVAVEKARKYPLRHDKPENDELDIQHGDTAPRDYKFIYPEFLPNPDPRMRDRLNELLERRDMMRRRSVIDIPEFYVGSIIAVTVSDLNATNKRNRFVGICINRNGYGLRANFTLRNFIDNQGIEIRYDIYNPTVQKVEVIRLEKRLDEELFYLRDAPAQYSTFSFDMTPIKLPPNAPIPINNMKVKLNPMPWHEKWERKNLKGIEPIELPEKYWKWAANPAVAMPWNKHDLMKEYRSKINDTEAGEIMSDVHKKMEYIQQLHTKQRKHNFIPPSTSKTDK